MKHFYLTLITFLTSILFLHAQEECSQRYRSHVFKVAMEGNVLFGHSEGLHGDQIPLKYDVYMPKDDTATLRPLVILWHGGAFLDMFKKTSPDIVALAKDLARMGYVAISPDYRGIRDVFDFFRKKDLIKEVAKASIDGNKAICHILEQIDNGNPYRIDKDAIFAGGVSGGALLGLHLILLNETDDLSGKLADWAREVDGGIIDELLANKYCGNPGVIKGFFNISGALVDTSFIEKSTTGFLHFHGTKDDLVPYDVGKPLWGLTDAPTLYGSKPIHEKLTALDSYSKFYSYKGLGHVPFLNLDIGQILKQLDAVNKEVYIETLEGMVEFMFSRITCEPASIDELSTGIFNNKSIELQLFPNPTSDRFQVNMPENNSWSLQVLDISGKLIQNSHFTGMRHEESISNLPHGMYVVQITDIKNSGETYVGKIIKE